MKIYENEKKLEILLKVNFLPPTPEDSEGGLEFARGGSEFPQGGLEFAEGGLEFEGGGPEKKSFVFTLITVCAGGG